MMSKWSSDLLSIFLCPLSILNIELLWAGLHKSWCDLAQVSINKQKNLEKLMCSSRDSGLGSLVDLVIRCNKNSRNQDSG